MHVAARLFGGPGSAPGGGTVTLNMSFELTAGDDGLCRKFSDRPQHAGARSSVGPSAEGAESDNSVYNDPLENHAPAHAGVGAQVRPAGTGRVLVCLS